MPSRTRNGRRRARAGCSLWKATQWIVSAALAVLAVSPVLALPDRAHAVEPRLAGAVTQPAVVSSSPAQSASTLESAASRAGAIGRKVAMSLIALGFAVAAIVLVFRRDFKDAAGVFVVGLLAVLLATPAGVDLLHGTVNTLFGS
ncbi:MAG: hypothetical protein ACTHM1_00065 [Solirubrobacteraceae bacterium]